MSQNQKVTHYWSKRKIIHTTIYRAYDQGLFMFCVDGRDTLVIQIKSRNSNKRSLVRNTNDFILQSYSGSDFSDNESDSDSGIRIEMFKAVLFASRQMVYHQTFTPIRKHNTLKPYAMLGHEGIRVGTRKT